MLDTAHHCGIYDVYTAYRKFQLTLALPLAERSVYGLSDGPLDEKIPDFQSRCIYQLPSWA